MMWREFKDIDYMDLLKLVNMHVKHEDRLNLGDIFNVVDHWARQGKYVT